jgi:hypothetical protein
MRIMTANKPTRLAKLLLLAGIALVISGCQGQSDLREWVAQEKAKRGAPIPPLPVIKTFETFTYTDQDKRDPFSASPDELNENNGPRPDEGRARQPLEAYSLDSLKMVGTIGWCDSPCARERIYGPELRSHHRHQRRQGRSGRIGFQRQWWLDGTSSQRRARREIGIQGLMQ